MLQIGHAMGLEPRLGQVMGPASRPQVSKMMMLLC